MIEQCNKGRENFVSLPLSTLHSRTQYLQHYIVMLLWKLLLLLRCVSSKKADSRICNCFTLSIETSKRIREQMFEMSLYYGKKIASNNNNTNSRLFIWQRWLKAHHEAEKRPLIQLSLEVYNKKRWVSHMWTLTQTVWLGWSFRAACIAAAVLIRIEPLAVSHITKLTQF